MDAMLIYSETPNLHTHTLKVAVIDPFEFAGEFGFEAFREHCAAGCICWNRCATNSSTSRGGCITRCGERTARSTWITTCGGCRCPHRAAAGSWTGSIGQVASTPLDRSHPLWEFHFAEGLADSRFAVIGKVHHALADGVASVNLLARAMDLEDASDERDSDEAGGHARRPADLLRAAARDHARQVAELPGLIRDAAVGDDAGTPPVQGARRAPGSGRRVRRTADLPQPRGVTAAPVRQRRRCRWPTSKRPPRRWASRSTTWC